MIFGITQFSLFDIHRNYMVQYEYLKYENLKLTKNSCSQLHHVSAVEHLPNVMSSAITQWQVDNNHYCSLRPTSSRGILNTPYHSMVLTWNYQKYYVLTLSLNSLRKMPSNIRILGKTFRIVGMRNVRLKKSSCTKMLITDFVLRTRR